ncbi:NADPH:quinone reductase [Actinacidiphila yanglinensis]|uniref:NADPH:quinone reductase n=1 Tax=Actinacidiphila yanglinensis TaxID=310779 RepID=A0A1H6D7V1_9ACTN|nr:NADP-dependent oxidoreductase [Actinacidiphila yanglinensis]SEG81164.1 NADPH:quinone reductase [Actinacidiphila yanglinensis]
MSGAQAGTPRSRAVRFDRYGDLDVLYLAEVEVPVPAEGEVVVRMRAASVNPGETAIRVGALADVFPTTFPSGEGSDLAGVVDAVGPGVTEFAAGDEVLGWSHSRSSHADHVVVGADQLIRKPEAMSWEVAGSLYVAGCTAYAAVRAVGAGDGDIVAVSAAAGGVGTVAVQLLRLKGATVLGIGSAGSADDLTSLGATPVAYGDGLAERLRAAAPDGIDAFIDLFGPEYVELAVELGVAPERIDTVIAPDAARKYGARTEGSMAATSTEVLAELADLAASGRLTIPIAATYPLERVKDAYEELARRHTHGKIVLVP